MIAGLLWLALAHAEDDSSRDEDIFGAPSSPTPPTTEEPAPEESAPPQSTTTSNDDAMLGESAERVMTDRDILDRLGITDDRLAIGGRLYLRLNGTFYEDEPAREVDLSSPNLLDVYLDARPNDRVRAFAQARTRADFTVRKGATDLLGNEVKPVSVTLDQLWLRFDIARHVFFTTGRQRIKWGAGHLWNPTDFLNQQTYDPLSTFDERTGVGLVKVHVPVEPAGLDFYAIGDIEGVDKGEGVGGAARIEWAFGSTAVSTSLAGRKDQPLRLGADVSTGVWLFDLHAEAAVQHGQKELFYTGRLDFQSFEFPESESRVDDWIPQVVGGAEIAIKYSDEDNLILGAEYLFNDAGYATADLYPWLIFNGAYHPFYVGRHYVGGYAVLAGPGQWDDATFTATALSNLSDRSGVARLDFRTTVLTHLNFNAFGQVHFGKPGEFRFELDIPPVPVVEGLEEGLEVPAPLVDLGVGASVAF